MYSKEQVLQILDGLMLGDGCIYYPQQHKYKNPKFSQKSKHLEYAEHLVDTLSVLFTFPPSCPNAWTCKRNGNTTYALRSNLMMTFW
jgi:hypothetical protein